MAGERERGSKYGWEPTGDARAEADDYMARAGLHGTDGQGRLWAMACWPGQRKVIQSNKQELNQKEKKSKKKKKGRREGEGRERVSWDGVQ
ncbi:hypothetical protein NL676_023769 [Syzygium grande]|nr:hypothetical protein NL676_023769 [Syzygium grande]